MRYEGIYLLSFLYFTFTLLPSFDEFLAFLSKNPNPAISLVDFIAEQSHL